MGMRLWADQTIVDGILDFEMEDVYDGKSP
jgi:hypothetical protein